MVNHLWARLTQPFRNGSNGVKPAPELAAPTADGEVVANETTIDWDADVVADPAESYQSLVRSLQRTEGFSLFFVRCVLGDQADLVQRLQADLPTLHMQRLELTEELVDGNLYQRVAALPDLAHLNVLFISGLEKSLDHYVKSGYGGQGDYYKLDTVPRVLGHLNLQRERFRDDFPFCFVFFLSAFGMKYITRRAPDFFDWRSGIFEFVPDAETVGQLTEALRGNYAEYLTWSQSQRLDRIRDIQGILEEDQQTPNQQASLWWEKGNILAADQNYEAAIASYEQAVAIKPDYDAAWNNRGVALSALGRKEEAIASYEQAVAIKPDDHEAWFKRGNALYNLGRKEEAIASYEQAVAIKPDKHEAWYNRGVALSALGRNEEAIASYEQAVAIKPDYHEAWYNRGNALSALGRKEEAIASYDAALALKPDYYRAWDNRGDVLVNLKRYEEAIASYDLAIAINPEYRFPWKSRAVVLTRLGQFEAAHESFDRAISLKQDDGGAHYDKACCYGLQQNIELAIETLQHAIALDSKYRELAKTDSDFDGIRNDERFRALIGESVEG